MDRVEWLVAEGAFGVAGVVVVILVVWASGGSGSVDGSGLSVWYASSGEVSELTTVERIEFIGVNGDDAISFTEDDFDVRVERFPYNGDCVLYELDDSSGLRDCGIVDGYLYLIGGNIASLVPLSDRDLGDSEPRDEVRSLDFGDGILFVAGRDESSWVAFSLDLKLDKLQEYDGYAAIAVEARVTTTEQGGISTLMFDVSTDDHFDEIEYRNYLLVPDYNEPVTASSYKEYMQFPSHLTTIVNNPEHEPEKRPLVTEASLPTTEAMARVSELSNVQPLTGWDGDKFAAGWPPDSFQHTHQLQLRCWLQSLSPM